MRKAVLLAAEMPLLLQFTHYDRQALAALGYEIHMVCPLEQTDSTAAALAAFQETHPDLHWHHADLCENPLRRQNRAAVPALRALLESIRPALLHCHGTAAAWTGRRAVRKMQGDAPVVFYTAHDFRVFGGCRPTERLIYGRLERTYSPQTDVLLTVCPEDAAYAKAHLGIEKQVALDDVGLRYDRYATPLTPRAEVRRALGIPEEAILLVSVGALRMQKRLRIIIQAMARLRRGDQLHLILCGEGAERLFLEKLTAGLGLESSVHFLGYRTDIPDLLGAADIFCAPGRREGCGMAQLEAMAAGLPLITVRSHGVKCFTQSDEGAVCLHGDLVRDCAAAIERLSGSRLLRRQMGAHNRVTAKVFYAPKRMLEMRELYRTAVQEK